MIRHRLGAIEREHSALVHWSAEQIRRGLPSIQRTVDPAWFVEPGNGSEQGWSLVCEFDAPPELQGTPSRARVRFLVSEAPHERLGPGTRLQLFERPTGRRALVEILD